VKVRPRRSSKARRTNAAPPIPIPGRGAAADTRGADAGEARAGVDAAIRVDDELLGGVRRFAAAGAPAQLEHEREQAADVRRRVRRARDRRPARRRHGRRHVAPRRDQGAGRRRRGRLVDRGDHAGTARRKAAALGRAIDRGDDGDAARERGVDQATDEPVRRAAEAEVDDLRAALDRGAQAQGEAEAVARGVACRLLDARAQREHPRAGCDAGDADPVVGARRDDAGDCGAVQLADPRPVATDQVGARRDLPGEIGMIELHAAVDHGDAHVAAGRAAVQLVETPGRRGGLQREQRIVVCERPEDVHRLCPGDARLAAQRYRHCVGAARVGHRHHVAVETDDGHRPLGEEGEAVPFGERRGDPPPRRAAARVGVAARVVAVGAEVRRRQVEEHEHLRAWVGRRRRRARGVGRAGVRGEREQREGDQQRLHLAGSPSSDSTRATAGSARSRASASAPSRECAADTRR
jgi:hypothetical protein